MPRPRPHTARFYHGSTEVGWTLAQHRGVLLPRDLTSLFAELERVVGLPSGALMQQELEDPASRLEAFGAIWVAEPFYTAVHYATHGSELVEHKLRAALALRFGWERWGADANTFVAVYWSKNRFRPVVLALDVPYAALSWYRDQPDPEAAWRKIHRAHSGVNCALEPPVPVDWVVAAIEPVLVAAKDREMPTPPLTL